MDIRIQSVHFDASSRLEDFIRQKVGKLDQFSDDIIGAEIILRLDKSETSENKLVDIELDIPGNNLFAKKQSKTFEEAVDLACDALRKQLDKRKEKLKAK
ncbi:MAG: raiA [Anaerophaga sp.]|uniref:ribosome hibernation-promoting factor, HPF/YfiA family n=1 Tax=Anaerophaga thermohalophila TaxID=177400 RepID=UPI000237CDCD|nr:ribosome-associated translation inhibitor RaiA [Anaerophaga thermohalophila]MBZ4676014.1 raiA [Anaerophaga sp.]MDI3520509.1 putative sigma-54 modulation protein [Anaerophaga sp.]MDK2840908.1 putative sigma-54 modulation protein [Anaerophaga sp.]MDN5289770.1 putative sigma-54 modulation protein [Anaerophaga sp.]